MKRLIVTEMVTLDGVMEAPGGEPTHPHTGWVFDYADDEYIEHNFRGVVEAESQLIGRVTYESFAGAWPQRTGEFADRMNSMPKYVVSSTLTEPLEWENSTLLTGDVGESVARLKEGDGGPILVAGSATLVHALTDLELVDEYRLMVFPVVVGSGKRLFADDTIPSALKLVDGKVTGTGVFIGTYEPAGEIPIGSFALD